MRPVQLLSEQVVNQIAAGEVVERPASVVKELVENAIDAGATRIDVALRAGGSARIRVSDNGHGMRRSDALLAMERHATSKIRAAEDLVGIDSLGFRGEALPAIASVSRFELTTRPSADEVGTRVRLDHGRLLGVEDAGCAAGTDIDVRALFGAVPARRKFLRSVATEQAHCVEAVLREALLRPTVAFRVTADDRTILDLPEASDVAGRVRSALGDPAAVLWTAEVAAPGVTVSVWVAPPEVHHAGATGGLYLYVGTRAVRDPVLRRAVLDGWRDLLPKGRYPVGVVAVQLPAGEVDVNVHPAKVEVRFRDPRGLTDAVGVAMRAAADRAGTVAVDLHRARAAQRTDPLARTDGPPLPLPARSAPVFTPRVPAHPDDDPQLRAVPVWWVADGPTGNAAPPPTPEVAPRVEADGTGPAAVALPSAALGDRAPTASDFPWRSIRPLGVVDGRWIVAEREGGLVVLDRRAIDVVHRRARWADGAAPHALVAPVRVPVGEARAARLADAALVLERFGFAWTPVSARDVVVTAVPDGAAHLDVGALIREVPVDAPAVPGWLAERAARVEGTLTPFELRALLVTLGELGAHPEGPPRLLATVDVPGHFPRA
jgi:DNA mismatch repair protein MutL